MERQFYRWLHTHENIIMNTWSTSANRSPPKILYSGPLRHMVKLHSVRGKMVCFIKAAWQCIRRHLVHIVYVYLDVYVGYDCHLKKKKKKHQPVTAEADWHTSQSWPCIPLRDYRKSCLLIIWSDDVLIAQCVCFCVFKRYRLERSLEQQVLWNPSHVTLRPRDVRLKSVLHLQSAASGVVILINGSGSQQQSAPTSLIKSGNLPASTPAVTQLCQLFYLSEQRVIKTVCCYDKKKKKKNLLLLLWEFNIHNYESDCFVSAFTLTFTFPDSKPEPAARLHLSRGCFIGRKSTSPSEGHSVWSSHSVVW